MDSIVSFANGTLKSAIYRIVLLAAAALFNETFMTFSCIDTQIHGLPAHLLVIETYPTLLQWPQRPADGLRRPSDYLRSKAAYHNGKGSRSRLRSDSKGEL
jgi:hypothetical protein